MLAWWAPWRGTLTSCLNGKNQGQCPLDPRIDSGWLKFQKVTVPTGWTTELRKLIRPNTCRCPNVRVLYKTGTPPLLHRGLWLVSTNHLALTGSKSHSHFRVSIKYIKLATPNQIMEGKSQNASAETAWLL